MKCVMVMFDSLNRHMLPAYGCDDLHAPNFRRLQERSATFDTSYVCSMPCMPARRDFHTARPNFLHCGWGPLEPFDDSVPQLLSNAGTYTHLCSDHYHYWEDGGATYHGRYDSWEFYRGQEGDPFIGQVRDPIIPPNINGKGRRSDWVNREHIRSDEQYPQSQTFKAGVDFIDRNADADNWFLQLECFDPHEPFTCDRKYRDLYPSPDSPDAPLFDWPPYGEVTQSPEEVARARRNYKALVSKCDASLGDVLDAMDRHNLWDDTMLILWTDHGFLLGEHSGWAKGWAPMYEELSHTPLFVWDPRHPETAGQRRKALVQPSLDLGPTLLEFFGQSLTPDMRGRSLMPVIENDTPVRETAIFGYHGNTINVTDGRYVYMRQNVNDNDGPLNHYTLMPTAMRNFKKISDVELAGPFSFTKGCKVMKLPGRGPGERRDKPGHMLWDLQADPQQTSMVEDSAVEERMIEQMAQLMSACDAPPEVYQRVGIEQPA